MSYIAILKNPLKTARSGCRCGWLPKFNQFLPCPRTHLWWNSHEDPVSSLYAKLLTNRQTNKQTNAEWNT